MTWDSENYDQFIKRIFRQGNTQARVFNHIFVVENTIDERVLEDSVYAKGGTQNALLLALNAEIYRDGKTAPSPIDGHDTKENIMARRRLSTKSKVQESSVEDDIDEIEEEDEDEAPAPRRKSRTRTRAAAPVEEDEDEDEDEEPAPRRRSSRSATKAKLKQEEPEDEDEDEDEEDEEPVTRRAKRQFSKAVQEALGEGEGEDEDEEDEEPAPKKAAPRKRAPAKTAPASSSDPVDVAALIKARMADTKLTPQDVLALAQAYGIMSK